MTLATIPNHPAGTDRPRSIALLLANSDAIATFLNNRNIDPTNLTVALCEKLGLNDADARRGFSSVATSQSTSSSTPVDLATVGPSVTVKVPGSGSALIAIYMQVDITNAGGATAGVNINEGGTDVGTFIARAGAGPTTMYSQPGQGTTSISKGSWIVYPALAIGTRAVKMTYFCAGGVGTSTFASRKLWVKTFDPT